MTVEFSGPPCEEVDAPEAVRRLAGGASLRAVWANDLGGVTFELGTRGEDHRFVKWAPALSGLDLSAEGVRMEWAGAYTPVPRPLEFGTDNEGSWLVTRAIEGETAVSPRWKADPPQAVAAIGQGLRAFHDALPVEECPFSWSAEARVDDAQRRAAAGLIEWQAEEDGEFRGLSLEKALDAVADIPGIDRPVVCQADACSPNTLIGPDGRWAGHVDLGHLGVADRWADLAVSTWSSAWNYGPGWEAELLGAYGVARDRERTFYYRLLWALGP